LLIIVYYFYFYFSELPDWVISKLDSPAAYRYIILIIYFFLNFITIRLIIYPVHYDTGKLYKTDELFNYQKDFFLISVSTILILQILTLRSP